jgi:HlyD family type I secretion membrane fusion protein
MNAAAIPTAVPPVDPLTDEWVRASRRAVVAGIAAIGVAAVALVVWSVAAPLGAAVVTTGLVKVDTQRKTVQHRDGGTVRDILVREGDRVSAGQALVILDDTRIDASYDLARGQLDAVRMRQSRLAAERDGAATWTPDEDFRARLSEPRLADAAARETALFAARRSALDAQARLVATQIAAVNVETAARQREHASLAVAMDSMQEELELNEALLEQRYVSRTRVTQLTANAAEYQSRMDGNQAELAQARQRAADLELRLSTMRETFMQDVAAELRDVTGRRVELEEQVRTALDAMQRKVVTAPVSGLVLDLRVTTPGGAIGPRDPLLDIVPEGQPLLVEARVPLDSIAELHAGAAADVRLTAYRQRTTPLIAGKVVYVSPDALADRQSGAAYYLIHVELDPAALTAAGPVAVQPGMGAEVYVRARDRTALEFLVEPLVNATRRSLREH